MKILMRCGRTPFDAFNASYSCLANSFASNTGNMAFSESIFKALYTKGTSITPTYYKHSENQAGYINETYDYFIIPLADGFRDSFVSSLDALTALIKRLTIPCIVVGVGVRADIGLNMPRGAILTKAVKNFVAAVLDKSASIGVRGEITQRYLNQLGFSAVDVIGCPSMYMNGEKLNVIKKNEILDSTIAVCANVTTDMPPAVYAFMERSLALLPKATMVMQRRDELELLLWGKQIAERRNNLCPTSLHNLFIRENRACCFVDIPSWISHLKTVDFTFGTRLHGNIVSLLAGTPCFLIAHDSRTLELAQYHNIPHILAAQITPSTDLRTIYDETDFSAPSVGHHERFQNFLSFLEKNKVPHSYADEQYLQFDKKVAKLRFERRVDPITSVSGDEMELRLNYLNENTLRTIKAANRKAEKLTRAIQDLRVAAQQTESAASS